MTPEKSHRAVRSARVDGIRRRDRRRRPGRPVRGDPPEAARARKKASRSRRVRAGERLRGRRAHPLGRGHGSARADRTDPRLEGKGRAAQPAGDRRPLPVPDRRPARSSVPNWLLPDSFQNHGNYVDQPRQRRALAGAAGRGARRRDLPGLSRGRSALQRRRRGAAASPPATWASARTASRPTNFQLGMELHAQVHDLLPKARAAISAAS